MKSLKLFSLLAVAIAISLSSTAQTYTEKKVYSKTSDERAHAYMNSKWNVVTTQKESTAHTSDSAFFYIDTINVAANESGILEVQVLGYNDSLSISITGKKIVRYKKVAGTLTLGTATDLLATETDSGLQTTGVGGTQWTIVAVSNHIYVKAKGKTPYNIYWECLRSQQKKVP